MTYCIFSFRPIFYHLRMNHYTQKRWENKFFNVRFHLSKITNDCRKRMVFKAHRFFDRLPGIRKKNYIDH